jgi:hypothetical protein
VWRPYILGWREYKSYFYVTIFATADSAGLKKPFLMPIQRMKYCHLHCTFGLGIDEEEEMVMFAVIAEAPRP